MKTFKKLSNGHTLEIIIDDEALLEELNAAIEEYEDLKTKLATLEKGTDKYDSLFWEYNMQRVYSDLSNYCTVDEILDDLKEFKQIVLDAVMSDGSELFEKAELKKNGTFKKTCKPLLKDAINGYYWEDSYGWNTRVLRLEPINDTQAEMRLDHIVVHY